MPHLLDFNSFGKLNEAHYADLLGNNFEQFVEKYRRLVKSRKLSVKGLYVQFSNYKDNRLDRTAYSAPDHADPTGTYAYPLDYVLKHPADVWYGAAAKNARILRDKSQRKLVLSDILDETQLYNRLAEIGFDETQARDAFRLAKRLYPKRNEGKTRYAKLFLSIVQMDMATNQVKSAEEQTRTLRRAYDAIEDESKKIELAIINDREPEQICFLTRTAFEVVDVIRLHGEDREKNSLISLDFPMRKTAAQIAPLLGNDRLVGEGYQNMFWTKQGRRIELSTPIDPDYIEKLKMGQKRHRHDRDFNARSLRVRIDSEYGLLSTTYASTHRLDFILGDITRLWAQQTQKAPNPAWVPETSKVVYDQKQAVERKSQEDENVLREIEAAKRYIGEFTTTITKWNKLVEQPYPLPEDRDTLARVIVKAIFLAKRTGMKQGDFERIRAEGETQRTRAAALAGESPAKAAIYEYVQFFYRLVEQFPHMRRYTYENFWKGGSQNEYGD